MSRESKRPMTAQQLDGEITRWLAGWPDSTSDVGPGDVEGADELRWQRFERRVNEQIAQRQGSSSQEEWLQPPFPDELTQGGDSQLNAGETTMTHSSKPPPSRVSLKEYAQRVSVAPKPTDGASESPVSEVAGVAKLSVDAAQLSTGPDSVLRGGLVDVDQDAETVPQSVGVARKSPDSLLPASAGGPRTSKVTTDSGAFDLRAVIEEGKKSERPPAEQPAKDERAQSLAVAQTSKQKRGRGPVVWGVVAGAVALAAGVAIFMQWPKWFESQQHAMSQAQDQAELPSAAEPPSPIGSLALAEPTRAKDLGDTESVVQPEQLAADEIGEESGEKGAVEGQPLYRSAARGAGVAKNEGEVAAEPPLDKAAAAAPVEQPAAAPPVAPAADSKSQSLAQAMESAVGAQGKGETSDKPAEKVNDGSLPETPSQGAIQGALASVRDAARACVVDYEDVSRATIVFSSSGTVSSVTVSGAAAGKSAAGCIQAALKRARVEPFKRSTFSVSMTIRP